MVRSRELRIWLYAALVAAFAFLVYANTLGNKFVYDDDTQILRNPWIRSAEHIPKFFTGDVWSFRNPGQPRSNYYRPIQLLAYLGLYLIAGPNPFVFHLANVLLHVACTLFVFLLARQFSNEDWMSVSTALLFAAHPIHTETVAWVAANTELLCALFYFLALYSFLRSLQPDGRYPFWLAGSLTTYFLGLLSKEMALSLPLVIFAYAYLTSQPQDWRPALRKVWPYLVCTAIYLALRISALGFLVTEQNVLPIGTLELLLSDLVLVGKYLRVLVLPVRMTAYHVFEPTRSPFGADLLGAVTVLLVLFGLLFRIRRRDPALAWAGSGVLLMLLPVLNPRAVGSNVFTERYLYIPSFAFLLGLVLLTKHVRDRCARGGMSQARIHRLGWATLAVILGLYSFQTVRRNADWHDNFRLYASTIRVSPNSPLMQNNYADILRERGDWEGARRQYLTAIQGNLRNRVVQQSDLEKSYVGLATVDAGEGRLQEAEQMYRQVLAKFPGDLAAYMGLGDILFFQKKYKEALELFNSAVTAQPKDETLWHNKGVAQIYLGQFAEAVESFRKATEIYPCYVDAWNNLAVAYMNLGHAAEAEQAALIALRCDPKNHNSHHYLGLIYYEMQDWVRAERQFQLALKDKPEDPTIPYYLGVLRQKSGDYQGAVPYFAQASRLQPGFVDAQYQLAVCERHLGHLREAKDQLEKLRSANPNYGPARNELGEVYLELGELAQAEAEFRAALQAQPGLDAAMRNLRRLQGSP